MASSLTTDNIIVPLPSPFSRIPRVPILFPYASPIEQLHRLPHILSSHDIALFIKRDDFNSGLSGGGGNKLRKLEYVLADAVSKGVHTLVTTGGVQSNHMRQTAAAGARFGMETVLLPQDRVPNYTAPYRQLGNVQLTNLMSATHLPNDTPIEMVIKQLEEQGKRPYFIPSGASLHELGGLGYARCAFEIAQQERELGQPFDVVVVPTMSGSTLGGLVAGFKLLEKKDGRAKSPSRNKLRLIGVLASPKPKDEFKAEILDIARTAGRHIGLDPASISEVDFEIDDRWSAGEYGRLDEKTMKGIKLMASVEGIITDPVYSGKALTGLLEMARNGEIEKEQRVLFLHTGGIVSVSAYENLR